jgi:hypothetical protein
MLTSFARLWNRRGERKAQPIRKRTPPTKKKPTTRPTLEALEDRLVPTVAFTPKFGGETYTGSNNGMQNPDVYLIFEGNWSQANENTVIASLQNILNGPYLSGLKQYGSDGHATYAGSWNATTSLSGNPSTTALQAFLQKEIAAHPRNEPGISDTQHAPIYVVLTDPTSSGTGVNNGYNQDGRYKTTINGNDYTVDMHMIWLGTGKYSGETNAQWKDVITHLLSHELVETLSDPTGSANITAPKNLPTSLIPTDSKGNLLTRGQIGDYEPDSTTTKYGYRLNGDWVAAYWSKNDQAFIVPDGNTQTFNLQPIWNSSNIFNGQYNLFVNGDQRGSNYNDTITIDQTSSGGVRVNLNGETATFNPTDPLTNAATIKAINVNTGGGTNQVNVAAVPVGVTLNVNSGSLGQQASNDTVTIGSGGSLAGIAGTVNVANASGKTQLIVEDTNDTSGRSVQVTNNAVKFAGLAQVNYTGASPNASGVMLGVTSLVVDGGSGNNTFTVSSTAVNTPLTLNTGPFASRGTNNVYINGSSSAVSVESYGNDFVSVGNAGSLAGIGGPVNVSNGSGQDTLVIDDSNDSRGRSIDISSNAVKFAAAGSEPAVTINYTPNQKNSNGQMVGIKQLTIWDAKAANQVQVDSVGANTDTIIEADTRDTLTGAAAGKVKFNRYRT